MPQRIAPGTLAMVEKYSPMNSLPWPFRVTAVLLASLYALASVGCDSAQGPTEVIVGSCRVLVDGQPLQDVRVTLALAGEESSKLLIEGVSDATGLVSLRLAQDASLPNESTPLRAAVESLGDWQVISPWSKLDKSPLRVEWQSGSEPLIIELPTKALRAL